MDPVRKLVDGFAIPIPKTIHIISYIILAALIFLTPSAKKGELLEFGGCWIFFFITFFPKNKSIYKYEL